ncbi:unnamed protein product [Laminaria digitata]
MIHQQHQHQQEHRRRRRPRPSRTQRTPPSHCSSSPCRARARKEPRSTFTAALTLLLVVCCCWCRHTASGFASSSLGGSSSSSASAGLTLRVRMPDGAVKRVRATAGETVDDIMSKIGMDGGESGEGLSTEAAAGSNAAEGSASVAALGLRNGDFLYVKSDAAAQAAAKAKSDALDRMKAAAASATAGRSKFVPFPDHARPPPPPAAKRVKTWQDIEAMQAQTFSLKPQKDSNVKKISVEQSAMDNFVGYLKETGLGKHRCALLFGRISPSTNGVKVEAMYEPLQQGDGASPEGFPYDSSAVTEAAKVAVAAAAQEGGASDAENCEAEPSVAAADVVRAIRVAELLGLRLVGWCLSHDKREHFMAARDVVTSSALQLMSMAAKGRQEGVLVATVTVPVNKTDGEVATEAFSVSNQTVQMFSEGVLADHQPDPTSDRRDGVPNLAPSVTTTVNVKEGGKETQTPETVGLVCNVAIVKHEGVLQTRFPPANRADTASLSDLKKCLFDPVVPPRAAAGKKSATKKKTQPSFLSRLSDFQLLVYLSRQMGFSRDFEELCRLVQKRDGKSPALGELKVVLENLCEA